MSFSDTSPSYIHERRRYTIPAIVMTGLATTALLGCEAQPQGTPEQRASSALEQDIQHTADLVLDLLARPQSGSYTDGNALFNDGATDFGARPDSYPGVYAIGSQQAGKNWVILGANTTEDVAQTQQTSVQVLYQVDQPLVGDRYTPLSAADVRQAIGNASPVAADVHISNATYSVIFQANQGYAQIGGESQLSAALYGQPITGMNAYEQLHVTDIQIGSATMEIQARANTHN